jgi:hypothetical protein
MEHTKIVDSPLVGISGGQLDKEVIKKAEENLSLAPANQLPLKILEALHVGQWRRPALSSSETSTHIYRCAERVDPPSLATLSTIMPGRNHRQLIRIIDCNFITQPLE